MGIGEKKLYGHKEELYPHYVMRVMQSLDRKFVEVRERKNYIDQQLLENIGILQNQVRNVLALVMKEEETERNRRSALDQFQIYENVPKRKVV